MALPSPAEQLRAAASCPVCLELFRDPVSLRCGHNFCRGCVERCGPGPGAAAGPLCCPQCRDAAPGGGSSSLRPSRELGHIAGIARELLPALLPAPPPGDGSVCGRHREPLRLFCREERALLCAECARERRERHRERHRGQERGQERGQDRERRERHREQDREQHRGQHREQERGEQREQQWERRREQERGQQQEQEREQHREQDREQEWERHREQHREQEREQDRERHREQDREQDREQEREQERGQQRERHREQHREQERGQDREQDRGQDREQHWEHRVVPVEEAAREYREQIQSCLQALKEEREKFLESRKSGAWRSLHLDRARGEGQHLAREFRELRRSLEEQQRLLLAQLGGLEAAIGRGREQAVEKVSEELSQLDTLIWEMEGKFQQPPGRFLQDIQQLLDSCETMRFQPPAEISPELERSLEDFAQRNILVRRTLRRCQDSLMFLLQEPASLTLDPHTAHPHLQLSADAREARGQLQPRDAPERPERFDFEPCVLARGGFTSGRHFWEVEVGRGGVWALGVVRESSRRKGPLSLTPKEGVWALEAFHSLTSPRAKLRLQPPPRRLRVALDYEGRRVAFFGAGDDVPILEYTRAAFNGERLRPWFKMGLGTRLMEVTRGERCQDRAVGGRAVSPLDWVGFGFSMRICS